MDRVQDFDQHIRIMFGVMILLQIEPVMEEPYGC
jgi:hypothetical protein